jgi:chitin synthase
MIPLRKFEAYEQQAWDTQTKIAGHSPQPSEGGFSYAPQRMGHSPRGQSFATPAQYAAYSQGGSRPGSVANFPSGPQPAFSPFNQPFQGRHSPAGSVAGSEYGAPRHSHNPFPAPRHQSQMSLGPSAYGAMSNLGMPPMPYAQPGTMTARNSGYSLAQWAGPGHQSSYSIASMNPFTDQNQARPPMGVAVDPANPTDDELVASLRIYLRTQDLLQVTKVGLLPDCPSSCVER